MVFGASKKLEQSILDAYERYNPKAVFIGTSCATGIIGEDIESISKKMEEKIGIPVIPLQCEGFRSKHWNTGFDATQHGILRQIVRKKPRKKQEDLVNVINLWGSDVFTPLLKNLNLRVNYVVDLATVEDLAQMSEAAATIGFCYTLSSYMAQALEQEFGVPEVKAPMPYGFHGTDEWIRDIGRVTNREQLAEEFIEREHKRIAPKLKELREKLKGVKGYVATGSAYAHGLVEVLRELVGDDIGSVVSEFQEEDVPIVFAETGGFKGNNFVGHEIIVKAIIDQYVDKFAVNKDVKEKVLINVWTELPYQSPFWRGDLEEIKRILEGAGFKVNILFGNKSAGVSEWKTIPNAEFIRKVVDFAGIDNTKAEEFIKKEEEDYYYYL